MVRETPLNLAHLRNMTAVTEMGGVIFPLTKFPAGARPVLELLPTGALSTGLRAVLQQGAAFPVASACSGT